MENTQFIAISEHRRMLNSLQPLIIGVALIVLLITSGREVVKAPAIPCIPAPLLFGLTPHLH